MNNKNSFSSRENIQSEEMLLLDLQTQQQETLVSLGIAEKASAELDNDSLNNLTRLSVALLHNKDEVGKTIEIPTIRFSSPGISSTGHSTTSYKYVPVAAIQGDQMELRNDFTLKEVTAVTDIIQGLKDAKAYGVLPHLSGDLANIHNPNTALMRLPKLADIS